MADAAPRRSDDDTPPPTDEVPEAFFEVDGDRVVPSLLARGPWDVGSAHGGPIAAIVGRAIENFEPDPELAVVRLSAEILRPVPLQPHRAPSQDRYRRWSLP